MILSSVLQGFWVDHVARLIVGYEYQVNVLLSPTMNEKPEKCQFRARPVINVLLSLIAHHERKAGEMPISSVFMTKRCTIFTWINQ